MNSEIDFQDIQTLLQHPIAFHRIFADVAGGVCPGLFLSQLFYWSPRASDADGWIYKTQEEWQQETALTRREQETARRILRDKKILEEKKEGIPCRLFFKLNREKLFSEILSVSRRGSAYVEQNEHPGLDKSAKPVGTKASDKDGGNVQTGLYKSAKQGSTKAPNICTETTSEITSETTHRRAAPAEAAPAPQPKSVCKDALEKEQEEYGSIDASSGSHNAQEGASQDESIQIDVDQISAPPGGSEQKVRRSGMKNIANVIPDVIQGILKEVEGGSQSETKVAPLPVLKKSVAKSGWICPGTDEERQEFLEWDADRAVAAKLCPRNESKGYAVAVWNKHQEEATLRFEQWQEEKRRQLEQPTELRQQHQPLPAYHRYTKEQHAVLIAEYRQMGLAEFLQQDRTRRYWIAEIRCNKKYTSLLTSQELKELRNFEP